MALVAPTAARSSNFWILPVEVLGSSPKRTARGTLKPQQQLAVRDDFLGGGAAAGFELDEGAGRLAPLRSGIATTATAATEGWR